MKGRPPNPHTSLIRAEAVNVVRAAANACGVTYERVISPCRKRELAEARFASMLVLHRAGWSYPWIAAAVGRDNHTTCLHGVARAKALEANDAGFAAVVNIAAAAFKGE